MKNLLSTLIELTTMGSIVIVFVIIVRVLLKKAPKIYSYALWSVVLFRLLCPYSFESAISPLPSSETIISSNITSAGQQVNWQTFELALNLEHLVNSGVTVQEAIAIPIELILGIIWILGIAIMLIYSVISLIKLRRKLIGATPLDKNIYLADNIKTPFVLGVIKPKIYLPSSINDSEIDFIIKHEQTHIKRLDHITRILAFVALCVHWFNPLVWIAYTLSAKDMEMSCDEAVMNKLGVSIKKEYASSLLRFEVQKHLISPLAFSEGDTKGRVKNIMKHKKTKVWVSILCIALVSVFAFMLMTNSKDDEQDLSLITGYINIKDNELLVDTVQIITSEDEELIAELGLDIEQDMPSGYLILNAEKKVDTLKLTDETKYIFTDVELKYIDENLENRLYETTSVDEFINGSSYQELDLENLEDKQFIPYFIEIQNGVVVKVTEDFRYTM